MLTLKIASGDQKLWFADVAQVSVVGQECIPRDVLDTTGVCELPWPGYSVAWYVDFGARDDALVSLLWVVFGEPSSTDIRPEHLDPPLECYYATEYAWLLGPNGDTIDRVAP